MTQCRVIDRAGAGDFIGIAARTRAASAWRFTLEAGTDPVLLVASVFFALVANQPFLVVALRGRDAGDPAIWGFALALVVWLAALHFVLIAPLANRWSVKPLLALLIVVSALTHYYSGRYGMHLDAAMVRNVLHTDWPEARELLSWALLPHLLVYAALPLWLLWRVRITRRPWMRAALHRLTALAIAAAVFVVALLLAFQPLASLLRNQRETRHLITPFNAMWSLGTVVAREWRGAARPRQPIGLDARPGPGWAVRERPMVVVMVVGETARAANWGLNGRSRQTTPELAHLPVLNFSHVTACGTATEVSLPCLFAPVGRRDYDEERIRGSESLLHVLARAGVQVHWRDNQSGCKGVCEGLPQETVQSPDAPGLCSGGHCFDEALLLGLDRRLAQAKGTQLLVLHMIGSHGPSYFRRYPAAFARFAPACQHDDLQRCTREQIVNAYDNTLLYTDHVLAQLIAELGARADIDSALLYVSDHGESLGENGLFLHGMPHAIAPDVQTQVPMVLWWSGGFARSTRLDSACLRRRADQPLTHDHVFHTLLGLLDVSTALYDPAWDLSADCRSAAGPQP